MEVQIIRQLLEGLKALVPIDLLDSLQQALYEPQIYCGALFAVGFCAYYLFVVVKVSIFTLVYFLICREFATRESDILHTSFYLQFSIKRDVLLISHVQLFR